MRTPLDNWDQYQRGFTFKQRYPDSFGIVAGQPHLGLDIMCPEGTPIYAPVDGHVQKMVRDQGGNTVHLNAGLLKFRFLHLSEFGKGGTVKEGDIIGYTGNTGLSTGPHLHHDVSRGILDLDDIGNFIDPELFYKEVRVALVSPREYDVSGIIFDFRYMGINLVIDFKEMPFKVEWYQKDSDNKEVDNNWFDRHVAHLGTGYDIVALVCDNYGRENNGFAKSTQYLGSWRCFINNTKKPRKYYNSEWNGENQVAGTLAHEILHNLDNATGNKVGTETVHKADQKGNALELRFNMGRFKGWDIPGKTRLFKWREYQDVELKDNQYRSIVRQGESIKAITISNKSVPLYRLAYSKFIPKP